MRFDQDETPYCLNQRFSEEIGALLQVNVPGASLLD